MCILHSKQLWLLLLAKITSSSLNANTHWNFSLTERKHIRNRKVNTHSKLLIFVCQLSIVSWLGVKLLLTTLVWESHYGPFSTQLFILFRNKTWLNCVEARIQCHAIENESKDRVGTRRPTLILRCGFTSRIILSLRGLVEWNKWAGNVEHWINGKAIYKLSTSNPSELQPYLDTFDAVQ